ncbi:nonstructural protein [Apis mellifera associated microvirus 3]|nr:nonstructural protein [Apis mellifera associated microvirus 3]AZL82770.1 nonstructural protein [Apis mellifera associated microvirus 3]
MKLRVFAVYDAKAEVYNAPFFTQTVGLALRGFTDEVRNPDSMLNKHPEDFSLFEIGEFDQLTGAITPLTAPVSIAPALELVRGQAD